MLEREIEKRFGAMLRKQGCLFLKFVSPGNIGVPDRIVICPDGRLYFVELKTEHGKVSEAQKKMIRELRMHGQAALVLRGMDECVEFAELLKRRLGVPITKEI